MSETPAAMEKPSRGVTAARTFAAALLGVFFAAAASALTTPPVAGFGVVTAVAAAALAVFALVSAFGICSFGTVFPRYGFALGSAAAAWLIPAEWRSATVLLLVLPLFLCFRLGFRGRGARWGMLMLAVVGALFLDLAPRCDVSLPEAAYLPITLLADKPKVRMVAVGEDIMRNWWDDIGYAELVAKGPADVAIAGNGVRAAALTCFDKYGMINRGDAYRRGVYRYLLGRLEPDGVLVLPKRDLDLLPAGDWHFAPLPGAKEDWAAARRGKAVVTDPEELDKRLQAHEARRDDPLLPAGAFAAMYYDPEAKPLYFEPRPERSIPLGKWWMWLAGGALLYYCIRVWLCRRERTSTFVAALENAAVLTLFSLGAARPLAEGEFPLGIPPQLLFAGLGIFLLPLRPGKRALALVNGLGAAALLLPFLFPDSAPVWWGCWLVAALSAAALREKPAAESPRATVAGSVAGVAAGAGIYAALVACGAGTAAAVLTICIALRVGLFLRHWCK